MRFFLLTLTFLCVFTSVSHASDQVFTMEEAVKRALEANPNAISVEKMAEASKSGRNAARSAFGPTLSTGYRVTHTPLSESLTVPMYETAYGWTIEAKQPIFTGFQLLSNAQKASLEYEYQTLQVQKTDIALTNMVQTSFLQYLMSLESVASSLKSLERAKEQLKTATAGYNLGLRPKIDVLQAQFDMTSTEATLIENESNRDSFRAKLNSLLNIPVDTSTKYVGSLDVKPYKIEFSIAVEKAFAQLPDVQMAQKSLAKAEKDLGLARSAFYPQIYAGFEWSTIGEDWTAHGGLVGYDPTNIGKPYNTTTFSLNASIPIFTSGQRYFNTKQASSGVDALKAQVELAYNTAALNVKTSLLTLHDSFRTVEVADRALDSARQSYADAKIRYESQLGTNLEMMTAQSDLADAELLLISSKANYLVALSNLYSSLGEIHPALD